MRRRLIAGAFALPIIAVSVLGTGLAANATQPSPMDDAHKVGFCHATHSAKNPYVFITTDKIAVVVAHSKHQDLEDVYPSFWYVDNDGNNVWFQGNDVNGMTSNDCMPGGG